MVFQVTFHRGDSIPVLMHWINIFEEVFTKQLGQYDNLSDYKFRPGLKLHLLFYWKSNI